MTTTDAAQLDQHHRAMTRIIAERDKFAAVLATFAAAWGEPHLAADLAASLTCDEADALAAILRAADKHEAAEHYIDMHAKADEEGDAHHITSPAELLRVRLHAAGAVPQGWSYRENVDDNPFAAGWAVIEDPAGSHVLTIEDVNDENDELTEWKWHARDYVPTEGWIVDREGTCPPDDLQTLTSYASGWAIAAMLS